MQMEDILDQVSLSEEIERGILFGEGQYGELLSCVDSLIQARWHTLPTTQSEQELHQAYLDSLNWVTEIMEKMV